MCDPKRFVKELDEYGYRMEVDVKRDDCNGERVHWHLCQKGKRIGQIWVDTMSWESKPDVSSSIKREAEELTYRYSSEIIETFLHNKKYGARY